MHPPKIFISATSGDLRGVRQIVKDALLTINCHPVEQTNFEPDARTVSKMLEGKIGDCQALIHIAGVRYGAEPEISSLPEGTARRSYTQLEYQIGRRLQEERGDEKFRVYTFICPEDFPYDEEPDTESEEKRQLQRDHRSRLFDDPHLREKPRTPEDIATRVRELQEQVFSIKHQFNNWGKKVITALAIIMALIGGLVGLQLWTKRDQTVANEKLEAAQDKIADQQKQFDEDLKRMEANITANLAREIQNTLSREKAAASNLGDPEEAARRVKAAEADALVKLEKAPSQAADTVTIAARLDATEVQREMTRILSDKGVPEALTYVAGQETPILKAYQELPASAVDAKRALLQPLLKAAELQATTGDYPTARRSYEEILALQPDWPEALDAHAWFFLDASYRALRANVLPEGVAAADENTEIALASFRHSLDIREKTLTSRPDSTEAARLVAVSLKNLGDFFDLRGKDGDTETALGHYNRSLKLREEILAANPGSEEAAREVSAGLDKLASFFSERHKPGDAEIAFGYIVRGLELSEKRLVANPDSDEAYDEFASWVNDLNEAINRDDSYDIETAVTYLRRSLGFSKGRSASDPDSEEAANHFFVSLTNLGKLLIIRDQPGDREGALGYMQRGLEIADKRLAAHPDSDDAADDVCGTLINLGKLLADRDQPGDADSAIGHFQRGLVIAEKRLSNNPGSEEAADNVFVILWRLSGLLIARNQSGDAETALEHMRRCVQIAEKRLAADPDSPAAARIAELAKARYKDALMKGLLNKR